MMSSNTRGNRNRFLAVEESCRISATSSSEGEKLLTVILFMNSLAIVLCAGFISVVSGNKLMYQLSACQMPILDVQTLLKRVVAK